MLLEAGSGQLMVHATIIRVLHSEHPAEIMQVLTEELFCPYSPLLLLLHCLVGCEEDTVRESTVDDVLVVVSCIVPSPRRSNGVSCFAERSCGRGVNQHTSVGMLATLQVERVQRCLIHLVYRVLCNTDRLAILACYQGIVSRLGQRGEVHRCPFLPRERRGCMCAGFAPPYGTPLLINDTIRRGDCRLLYHGNLLLQSGIAYLVNTNPIPCLQRQGKEQHHSYQQTNRSPHRYVQFTNYDLRFAIRQNNCKLKINSLSFVLPRVSLRCRV